MKIKCVRPHVLIAFLFFASEIPAFAQIYLPSFFSNNMVLQQKCEAPMWGWADPGTPISITPGWSNTHYQTSADHEGKWFVKITTPSAGGPYSIVMNEDTLTNVMIGEVWLCSGQSNMQWALKQSENADQEVQNADYPDIRLFYASRDHARTPNKDVYGHWDECTPKAASTFSAVAYYFGRELYKELHVPIGLLHFSWGGSTVQAWTNPEVLRTTPEGRYFLEKFKQKIDTTTPGELPRNYRDPGANYYGMIRPLIPYGINGVIWYQGENNVFEHQMYRNAFETMVKDWRNEWGEGDFPFYFVQLAPYHYSKEVVGAALRDAQRKALDIPNTGMAVTLDIGDTTNIHPKNKLDVGKRLSRWALAKTYGKGSMAYSGPMYESMKIERNKIRIGFTYTESGLYCKGDKLKCFTIAGKDKVFHPANAVIDGNTILVSSDEVKKPVAVRFAFENTDEPNLFNKEGLPASTFRTDNWDIITKDH
jgi:sialate O-acetylesterase